MNRLNALTIKYDSIFDDYLGQEGIEHSTGLCQQIKERVVWVANYDKSIYNFIVDNNLIPIANFKAYYFNEEIIQVNENNYTEHFDYVKDWETSILSKWLPKEELI